MASNQTLFVFPTLQVRDEQARDAATSAPVSSIAVSTESEHEDLPVKTETPASVAAVPMPDGDGTNASTNIGDAASQGTTGSAEPPRTDSSATATSRGSLSSYAGQTIMLERRGPRHYSMIGVVVPEGFQGEISLLVPAGYALVDGSDPGDGPVDGGEATGLTRE